MKKILLIFFLFSSGAFAEFMNIPNNTPSSTSGDEKIGAEFTSYLPPRLEMVADFANQNTEKYKKDNLKIVPKETLIKNTILKSDFTGVVENSINIDCNSFVSPPYTATIYDIDPTGGVVTCMFAQVKFLYTPMGLFVVNFPLLKEKHALNVDLAKQNNANIIVQKNALIQGLKAEKNQISAQTTLNNNYLNVNQLLLAGVLIDSSIIDFESSQSTGGLMLKDDYTSAFYNASGTAMGDNGKYIENQIISLSANFISLSNIVLDSLFAVMFVLLVFTSFQHVFKIVDKEDTKQEKTKLHFFVSLAIGIITFWPQTNSFSQTQTQYKEVESNFQSLSRQGFYLFSDLADKFTKVIIDNELNSLINKSGIGSATDIISNAAKMEQQKKISETYQTLINEATANFTDISLFSTAADTFPMSEKWAYATSYVRPSLHPLSYYHIDPIGHSLPTAYTASVTSQGGELQDYYPKYAFSFGYRINQKKIKTDINYEAFKRAYLRLTQPDPNQDEKVQMLKTAITGQYELFRDLGYLSILCVPVLDFQSSAYQQLFKTEDIANALDKKIAGDSYTKKYMGDYISSIPYMFVPGAQVVFSTTQTTFNAISAGASDTLLGWIGSKFGTNMAISIVSNASAYSFSQMAISVFLEIIPIIVIVGIGLVRFLIIMLKILAFYFGSLLLFPLVFTKDGSEYMKKFCVHMLLLMVEQPLFPISVYLAFVASGILHSLGEFVSSNMVSFMMNNNSAQNYVNWSIEGLFNITDNFANIVKIYLIKGALGVVVSLCAIALIWKFLISFHSYLFETLQVKASDIFDESLKGVASQLEMKGKI